jgi:hypothetical protein
MGCDDFSDFFFVTVENKSNKDIYFLVNWRYPDTIISPFKHIMQHIPTNKKVEIYQHDPIESIFKNAHGGPIVQFIIAYPVQKRKLYFLIFRKLSANTMGETG